MEHLVQFINARELAEQLNGWHFLKPISSENGKFLLCDASYLEKDAADGVERGVFIETSPEIDLWLLYHYGHQELHILPKGIEPIPFMNTVNWKWLDYIGYDTGTLGIYPIKASHANRNQRIGEDRISNSRRIGKKYIGYEEPWQGKTNQWKTIKPEHVESIMANTVYVANGVKAQIVSTLRGDAPTDVFLLDHGNYKEYAVLFDYEILKEYDEKHGTNLHEERWK